MSGRTIEMVVFDADMTLWDFHHGMRRSLGLRLGELQAEFPAAAELTVDDMIQHRVRVGREHPGLFDMAEVRRLAFAHTLAALGVHDDDLVAELRRRFFADRLRPDDLYDDTLPMLDALDAAGLRTAVLTNGNADLADADLDHRFEIVVRTAEHGVAKPDRAAYALIEARAGLPPERLAMVGDDVGPDVHGALAAGWLAIWLDRSGAGDAGEPAPHHVVRSLTDVPALVT